MTMAL